MAQNAEQLAESWRLRVTTISRNLMDLAEMEITKLVKARVKNPMRAYTGVTLNQATKAVKLLDSLWESYLFLARVVDEAVELVGKNGLLHDYNDKIMALLEGESVTLPVEHIPISARGLLSAADKADRVTPEVMMGAMERVFVEARDIFVKISTVEASLQAREEAMTRELSTLNSWSKSLGVNLPAALLTDPRQALAGVERDPLGCAGELDLIEAGLVKARTFLQDIEAERREVKKSLEEAQTAIAGLKEVVQLSAVALIETKEKILNPEGLMTPLDEEVIASLQAWRHALEENANAGRYAAVKVGVARLLKECAERLAVERRTYTQNRAGLDEREELKGRFKALCAKSKAYQERGLVLDERLDTLAQQTRAALAAKPCDLVVSRQLVQTYGRALANPK